MAEELLELYARRQVGEGHSYTRRTSFFRIRNDLRIRGNPRPDQGIEDVLDDMTSTRPMDRLICGDVGYGKTEVALRAAFKAVMDGKQVAMLVRQLSWPNSTMRAFASGSKNSP